MAREQRHNHGYKHEFPIFALILLFTGVIWFLNDLHILNTDIPWFPSILIIIAIGMLVRFKLMSKWFKNKNRGS
jgi:hypothetical protein